MSNTFKVDLGQFPRFRDELLELVTDARTVSEADRILDALERFERDASTGDKICVGRHKVAWSVGGRLEASVPPGLTVIVITEGSVVIHPQLRDYSHLPPRQWPSRYKELIAEIDSLLD